MNGRRSGTLLLFASATAAAILAISAGSAVAAPAPAATSAQARSTAPSASARGATTAPSDDTADATNMANGYTDAADGSDSAGDPCKLSTNYIDNTDILGIILFSFNMSTHWCWNGVIVTSHSTGVNHSITGTGAATGWEWIGDTGIDFSCYKASGSTKNCSGNEEHSTGYFYNVLTGQSCGDTLHQWENYKGQFFHSESTTC
jgi:hypothetical protein